MNVLSKYSSGIYVLPSPGYLNGHKPLTPEITTYLLNHMKTMFDYVIIDAGQSMSIEHLKAFEMSDDVILVSTLTIPCLSNTSRLMQSLTSLGYIKRDQVKIIIGGAPVNEQVREFCGADFVAADAVDGVKICQKIYGLS